MTSTDDREAGQRRLEVATLERMRWKPHNHTTRHLRPQGQCPACDQIHDQMAQMTQKDG